MKFFFFLVRMPLSNHGLCLEMDYVSNLVYFGRVAMLVLIIWLGRLCGQDPNPKAYTESNYNIKDQHLNTSQLRVLNIISFSLGLLGFYYYLKTNLEFIDVQKEGIPSIILIEFLVGIICCLALLFRLWSMRVLGKYFTFVVTIEKDHKLIKEGPYRYLVHPSYGGLMVAQMTSIWLLFRLNFLGLLICFVVSLTVYWIFRMKGEEQALREKFGKEFDDYVKERYRIIPFIF